MAIFVNADTKVIVQGLTGGQGKYHGLRNRAYGTQVVGGVTPGKGGQDVDERHPGVRHGRRGRRRHGRHRVVRRRAAEGRAGGDPRGGGGRASRFVVCITEGIPAQDEAKVFNTLRARLSGHPPARPELPGHHQPRQVQHRHHRRRDRPVADGATAPTSASSAARARSTYQALYELKQQGIGVSTCVGIGGDPVPGTNFIDCLREFQADPETHAIMMIGEIGGSAEEEAAEFIKANVTKPMSAYIAGVTAPAGKKMGHAGAIVSGGKGTAQGKMDALRAAGVEVGQNPTEAGELMAEIVAAL